MVKSGHGKRGAGRRSRAQAQRPVEAEPAERPRRGVFLRVFMASLVCTFLAVAAAVIYFSQGLPAIDDFRRLGQRSGSVTILAADGRVVARSGQSRGDEVTVEALPQHLVDAVISSEDRRFYWHFGIDPWGLGRAAWVNFRSGRIVQGGSTITQQLAKNLFLKPDRTMARKVQEAILAVYLEMSLSKDEILSLYLNQVYFGAGTNGVDAAARRYFNKPATRVTLIESAILAGLLKAPSRYSPTNGTDLAQSRAKVVLQTMADAGAITEEARDEAARTRPKFASGGGEQSSRYFTDWVMDEIPRLARYGKQDVVVETTLDLDLQQAAEAAVLKSLPPGSAPDMQVALVAMSPSGAVRAMIGGRAYSAARSFNRATQASRQPGSAFKPFVYLAALEAGFTPATMVVDQPVSYGTWKPGNFSKRNEGEMPLSQALAKSINSVAVQLCLQLGPQTVVDVARRMGILSTLTAVPAIALGTSEVSLIELVGAYAPFATGGQGAFVHGVKSIRTADGDVLYRRDGSGAGDVVSADHAGAMNRMLVEVLRSGTGRAASLGERPAAGKTGTSQKSVDAWFVGYTRQLVAGVWIGNDNNIPMGKSVSGGTIPAVIWKNFMTRAMAGKPVLPLPGTDVIDRPDPEADAVAAFDDLLARLFNDEPAAETPRQKVP